ncbi:heme o synthase [Methylocystis heyeri]|uniref:Protoheme IX farnesyltransferase n=1 Tax=Methylocystis heyeri TaxID=391905 RepID=A0A6B8KJK3_9HYPH|nr:heme o synthase [Methylocystis heyeri]QGM47709.1 protoheme IX farnesyltransferase [Methylocystis heyeri]
MSDASFTVNDSRVPHIPVAAPSDYFALLKPRVMSLVIFTALAGLLMAPVPPHPVIAFASLLAIAVGAGASGALNMWYDADIDAVMTRTRTRPIPAGRLTREEALAFGLVLASMAITTLGLVANWLAAGLLAFTIFFYVVIYTMWLKRSTPMNIVIGGAAGALPPMVGFAAAAGEASLSSFILFSIIFIWTPPHFWALALLKSEDYGRAGVPMLPNVAGPDRTRLEILIYSLILAPVGVAPYALGYASPAYGAISVAFGAVFAALAITTYRRREGEAAKKAARRLFFFSIFYLFALFLVLVVERVLHLAAVIQ